MTPAQLVAETFIADDADTAAAVEDALVFAGASLDELREQARDSRFISERARLAWFMISALVETK